MITNNFSKKEFIQIGNHKISLYEGIDELDEISGDEQQGLVWCLTHQTWEWQWIPRELVKPMGDSKDY